MIIARSGGTTRDRKVGGSRISGGATAGLSARRLASLALALATAACVGPHETKAPKPHKELTAEEFRDLLAKGTIQPVVAMQGEDAFAGVADREMGDFRDPSQVPQAGAKPAAPAGGEANHPIGPPAPPAVVAPENPYLVFGERIKVNPDGTITKPYPMRAGTGKKLEDLIKAYGNFPLWTPEMGTGPSTPTTVKIDLLEGWDIELYQDLRTQGAVAAPVVLADWLVVTTGQELLYEIEDFINLFAAGVPQIEIEAKIVEISFNTSLDLGVKPINGTTPIFDFPGSGTFIKSFTYQTPNTVDVNEALLTLGAVTNGIAFNAILEAIAGSENVSIISRPKIAVREGGRADISNTQKIPYLAVTGINQAGTFTSSVAQQEVGVKLYVVPRVIGTQTVALNIDIEASQISGRETLIIPDTGSPVTSPVVSSRTARTTVYLQPGQAVILGGLVTERNVEQITKVPLLGDIPILQYLFRSKFTRKEQANVLFFIRPRILQGIDVHREF